MRRQLPWFFLFLLILMAILFLSLIPCATWRWADRSDASSAYTGFESGLDSSSMCPERMNLRPDDLTELPV